LRKLWQDFQSVFSDAVKFGDEIDEWRGPETPTPDILDADNFVFHTGLLFNHFETDLGRLLHVRDGSVAEAGIRHLEDAIFSRDNEGYSGHW
jgi:hypothetical protein